MEATQRSEGALTRLRRWFVASRSLPDIKSMHARTAGDIDVGNEPRLIVPFRTPRQSLGPLRWAIRESRRSGTPLFVVNQAPIGVAVRNGPSASVAHQLGNPIWASIYSLASGLGAPSSVVTVAESTREHELVARYFTPGSRVVVSSSSHRRRLQRHLGIAITVVEQDREWTELPSPQVQSEPVSAPSAASTTPRTPSDGVSDYV